MPDSTPRFYSYAKKLRFFVRIRRFLQLKTAGKCSRFSDRSDKARAKEEEKKEEPNTMGSDGSCGTDEGKQLHFRSLEDKDDAAKEIKRLAGADEEEKKEEAVIMENEGPCGTEEGLIVLQKSVKQLYFGSLEDKVDAAKEIKRLAGADEEEKKEEAVIMENEGPCGTEEGLIVLQTSVKQLHFGSLEDKDAAAKEIKILAGAEEKEKKEETVIMGSEGPCGTEEGLVVLQKSVKQLHFGSLEDKDAAAKEIKRLAAEDLKTRKSLADLGVIPSLVSMLDSDESARRLLAIQTLIALANGTYTNKALMVEAGILSKLPENNLDTLDELERREFAMLLLSISALATAQFSITPSEMLPFLIGNLNSKAKIEAKEACLGALYNLSTMLESIGQLVSHDVVPTLLSLCSDKDASEKPLAILGNLVVTMMGKKAMENDPMVPESFIEIMTWEEKPKCQELAAYILMILAHQSSAQRDKMTKLGIVPVLLEVALLGSPLAQKRALKILQWFKDERQTRIGAHSGPQTGRVLIGSPINQRDTREGKKLMKSMVKQSLDKNMELITRRANNNAATDPCTLKALVISSSSKSLPY